MSPDIAKARGRAFASVNAIMVQAYWKIGQRIVEEEQGGQAKAAHGRLEQPRARAQHAHRLAPAPAGSRLGRSRIP